jgi:hypothetical protein
MRALLIAAGVFFAVFGGVILYFAASGTGHEYDLKFVLPIDTRQMPQPTAPPEVLSAAEESGASAVTDGRAEAGRVPILPERPPVQFGRRPGSASEGPPQ